MAFSIKEAIQIYEKMPEIFFDIILGSVREVNCVCWTSMIMEMPWVKKAQQCHEILGRVCLLALMA